MGSTGSGSFSDYSRHKATNPEGTNGGSSGNDKCGKAFDTLLEDVSRCFYYMHHGNIPPSNTAVTVSFNGVRLAVETMLGEEIGYLPTRFNYLKFCLDNGFSYTGVVTSSSKAPTPNVYVDITPV